MAKRLCRRKWRSGSKKPLMYPWICCCACRPGMTATPCARWQTTSRSSAINRHEAGEAPWHGAGTRWNHEAAASGQTPEAPVGRISLVLVLPGLPLGDSVDAAHLPLEGPHTVSALAHDTTW